MPDEFDVVVVGAGPAGENAAWYARDNGLSAALVESDLLGGTCTFWGCLPSKALLRPGEIMAAVQRVPAAAAAVTGSLDVEKALKVRDAFAARWDDRADAEWLERIKVTVVRGHGRLAGERTVVVETPDGPRELTATRAVVLAPGTTSSIPPVDGLDTVRYWTNREATSTKTIPERLLVLGGGAIGCELAQAFKRLGSAEVTIMEAQHRLIPDEEAFAGDAMRASFIAEGIRVWTDSELASVARHSDQDPLVVTSTQGNSETFDELIVATGRRALTDDLGLDTVGIDAGGFIEVDDQLRVRGLPWLYVVGDANGRALLTHQGKYQARVAADVIAGKDITAWADDRAVPRVIFTDPQVAAVGLTASEARARGIRVRHVDTPTGGVSGAKLMGKGFDGTSHLVIDQDRHIIVGATFTGPGVAELLHAATIAIVGEVPIDTLWHAVPAFPTVSEVWLRLLEAYREVI